ncbi:MAG: glycosyltransferase [Chloroflexota bacterium]|nr:glycosyltransferase [Chloroflexota bacterium]
MRVALVHDYLTQHGGAERVLQALHDLYPDAPVFTSIADFSVLPPSWRSWDVRQSVLKHVPGMARWHRGLLPVYPALFRAFRRDLARFDLILADSSAWAHRAPAPPRAVLVCYCHSPARFLYQDPTYLGPAGLPAPVRALSRPVFAALRRGDRRAAARVDRYVANSLAVAERIARAYGVQAPVVYPPVETERFAAAAVLEPEPWFLVVSRLVPHKRVDLAVDACTRAGIALKVIGDGRSLASLQARAGPTVTFLGRLDDDEVARQVARCRALILPGQEDLGMTAVEAQAAGRPVVAFGQGGALETVVPGETGVFFHQPTAEALMEALVAVSRMSWDPAVLRANAARFNAQRFAQEMQAQIDAALAGRDAAAVT